MFQCRIPIGNWWQQRATVNLGLFRLYRIFFIASFCCLIMTQTAALSDSLPILNDAKATRIAFSSMPNWGVDDHLDAWQVFEKHCTAQRLGQQVLRSGAAPPSAFSVVCDEARKAVIKTSTDARRFFEHWFVPYEILPASGAGFLTGYYEPETMGSLVQTEEFRAPLLARPADLVTIPQGEVWAGIPADFAAVRRQADGQNSIYPSRSEIMRGDLGPLASPIAWLKDDVEVFFMQVQGSGKVKLPNGDITRIAYNGRNGHPYSSIGRIVVREGLMPLEDATMDKLKAWLRAHPVEAKRIMEMNRSYVFFRVAAELSGASGPIGGAGLPLTPWRSIAVDRSIWAYGLPIWLEVNLPAEGKTEAFHRLTIAEDTGSAILGPARGDLYHGSGAAAGSRAGVLRNPARFVVLWPKERFEGLAP
jgi:membrane-bound lytic murein transglycosylase A